MFDILLLSKTATLDEKNVKALQLNKDVRLLREYKIPQANAVKFGDVNGDGLMDFMVLEPDSSAHVFDNSGKELWQ